MKGRFKKSFVVMAAVLGILLAGCTKTDGKTGVATGQDKTAKSVGKLTVAYYPGAIKSSLTTIAYYLGYYKDEGLDVDLVQMQNGNDVSIAVNLGKADIAPLGVTPPLSFISQGSDLVIFGGSASEGGNVIALPQNAEQYKDLKNFKGKRWATIRGGTGDFILRHLLKSAGVVPGKDVEVFDLPTDLVVIEAVKKGNADVGYVTSDNLSVALKQGLVLVTSVGQLNPNYVCCRQTANAKAFKEKPEAFEAYLRANIRAYKLIQTDHELAIKMLVSATSQSRDYVESALYGFSASKYIPDPHSKKIVEFYEVLREAGVVKGDVKIEDHINTALYKSALDQILAKYPDDKDYLALLESYKQFN